MAGRKSKNIDLPRHVTKTALGHYKYNRRVPLSLQERIGRPAWDYSLGTDPTVAARKALDLAAQHDRLISGLTEGETAGPAGEWLDTLKSLTDLLSQLKGEGSTDAWEQTRSYMRAARQQHPITEADRLKALAALVFGEKVAPLSDPFGTGQTLHFDPPPPALIPDDATDRAMFDATKGAVTTRLAELEATPADSSPLRLSVLLAAYLDARAVRPNTRASYLVKTDRLIAFAGDKPLTEYTTATLKAYRDELVKTLNPTSVADFFKPIKALWRWSAQEHEELSSLSFPPIIMPKDPASVEEKQWKPFSDEEAKRVLGLMKTAWGPDRKNQRLSDARAAAFWMIPRVVAHTGMRPVEVLHLAPEDIRARIIHIKHTKTGNQRKIPLALALADLPDFLASGGFTHVLQNTSPAMFARNAAAAFVNVIREGGLKNPKHVLYSWKHTLVERLQRQNVGDDAIRAIIGHVGGQGALRNYKTALGDTAHGIARMRQALDSIQYE